MDILGKKLKLRCSKIIFKNNFHIKEITIFFIIFLYPLIILNNEYGYFYFPKFITLILTSTICMLFLLKTNKLEYSLTNVALTFYIIFALISTILSYDITTAFFGLFGIVGVPTNIEKNLMLVYANRFTGLSTILCCIILYLTAYKVDKNEKLLKYMVGCASIVGIISILQQFNINIVPHESFRDNYGPYGTFGQPNFLGTYTVFILPAAISLYMRCNKRIWLLCSCLIYAGLLVSRTRGAWLAFALCLIIMAIHYLRKKENRRAFIILVACLLLVTIALMLTNDGELFNRVLSIPSNIASGIKLDNNAGSGRIEIWKQTLALLPKHWLFGVGPDNLIYYGITSRGHIVDKAHNIYLETAVTMGIPALIAYLVFLCSFLKPYKTELGFMYFIMILAYMVQGFFNIDTVMILPIFWIILGFSQANLESEKLLTQK